MRPDLDALPSSLAALLDGASLAPVNVGRSGSVVARAVRDGHADLFVKLVDEGSGAPVLGPEIARLQWLQGRWPVPELVDHGRADGAEWLVTVALDGVDATRSPLGADPEVLARALGTALRHLHDVGPVDGCPFDGRTAALVAHARARVAAGLVEPSDFQPIHQGLSAEELLDHVVDRQPEDPPDLVLTHGDFCLPNVVLAGDRFVGVLDCGLVGVGDRYRDLGIGARSVVQNLGPGAVGPFFDAYGIEWPDLARVDAFVMIDELF
ncbi:APH(3') family aminoglycoside O-phosphotransferase [Actinomarinicola tropica]|uniref:APH(3') family aminoglycoside O-phosphotransferase n=1 Tax=Actinomarinicola tropica TaxID=2789776 RepID=A0A5Q2RK27_9ACTN|nr:APH(3') family aminoglycoside O-phosphotransferase [Actinomarinicola tropica]QGG94921.1 APH(3') family aminoglycoside O-phosphotransferase [Actinomarinicola tropica]